MISLAHIIPNFILLHSVDARLKVELLGWLLGLALAWLSRGRLVARARVRSHNQRSGDRFYFDIQIQELVTVQVFVDCLVSLSVGLPLNDLMLLKQA